MSAIRPIPDLQFGVANTEMGVIQAPDLPDRQVLRNRVKRLTKKYFAFSETQIRCMFPAVPPPPEGRIAIVTDVGSGMRWTRWHCRTSNATRTAKPCGPDLPTLRSSSVRRFTGRRWLSKPGHRGERGISRNPSRRECRLIRLNLWSLPPAFFVCRRAMGEAITRHSLRPLQA
jgi:hypothetical protein